MKKLGKRHELSKPELEQCIARYIKEKLDKKSSGTYGFGLPNQGPPPVDNPENQSRRRSGSYGFLEGTPADNDFRVHGNVNPDNLAMFEPNNSKNIAV